MTTATPATVLDTVTAIEQRRSVKKFDPAHVMSRELLTRLMELTLLSPTSFNIQNWRFVVVTDPEQKKRLRAASWNQAQVEEASAVILLCGDLQAHARQPERYWANAPEPVRNFLVPAIGQYYNDNPKAQHDEALRSVGMAAQTLMLAAKAHGYDTCPMIGFDPVQVASIINLPADHEIGMMVVVGKALEPARERGGQLPLSEVTFWDRF